jgi:hypothetical protein
VMIRFVGPAAIFLTLAFALTACEANTGAPPSATTSFSTQPNAETGSPLMGFQPSKMGGGGGGY